MLMIKQVTSTTLVVFCLAHPAKFLVSLGDFISEYSQFVNHLTTIYDYIYTHILNICLYHEFHISFNILSKHVTILHFWFTPTSVAWPQRKENRSAQDRGNATGMRVNGRCWNLVFAKKYLYANYYLNTIVCYFFWGDTWYLWRISLIYGKSDVLLYMFKWFFGMCW